MLIGVGASSQIASAQNATVEKVVQANKVHRMTIFNGPMKSIHYFPLAPLTPQELTALRDNERETNLPPKLTIIVKNNGNVDKVEGRIVGMAGEWVIVERNNGIERIRESVIIRIFEPKAQRQPPERLPPLPPTPQN